MEDDPKHYMTRKEVEEFIAPHGGKVEENTVILEGNTYDFNEFRSFVSFIKNVKNAKNNK